MTLADFTSSELIVPQLQSRDVAGVIQELSRALQRESRIPDLLPFYEAALNREYLVSTDMGSEMAFPHARLATVQSVSFAVGRSDQPILWGHKVKPSIRLVFLMAVPASDSTHYLPLISGLARLGKDKPLLDDILSAS